jgi:hypothetical protein
MLRYSNREATARIIPKMGTHQQRDRITPQCCAVMTSQLLMTGHSHDWVMTSHDWSWLMATG